MLNELLEVNFNEKETELLTELCSNENIKNEIIEHIEVVTENDFSPNLQGLFFELIQEPSQKFIDYVEQQKELFSMNYGANDILENLELDFLEVAQVDTIDNYIRVALEINEDSDHLILALSGAYRELAKIFENHFNGVVLVFVNGTNAKHISI